jgi:hypothetical protein
MTDQWQRPSGLQPRMPQFTSTPEEQAARQSEFLEQQAELQRMDEAHPRNNPFRLEYWQHAPNIFPRWYGLVAYGGAAYGAYRLTRYAKGAK